MTTHSRRGDLSVYALYNMFYKLFTIRKTTSANNNPNSKVCLQIKHIA